MMEEKIYKILKEQFDVSGNLSLETDLIDEIGFESISLVELAGILSKETGIRVEQNQAIDWTTINSIVDTLKENQKSDTV